jgi:serine/threonine-protein kinase
MVMEYLEGQDLGGYIRDHGPLPVGLVADLVIQACEALAEAHSLGIVHRDLKPQNLFVTKNVGGKEKIKVLDFGISKTNTPGFSKLTQTSNVMGSPLYMAPEQMRSSKNADARIDVWALGIVIFELLTAQVPFEADTMPELCLKVVNDEPRAMADFRADVPPEMLAVIARCLQKNPADRFANAAEIASALEPLASPNASEVVSRARMAVSLAGPTMVIPSYPSSQVRVTPSAGAAAGISGPTVVSSATPASQQLSVRPVTTPSGATAPAWGATATAPAPNRAPLFVVGGVAVVAIAVAAFFATRKPPVTTPIVTPVPPPTLAVSKAETPTPTPVVSPTTSEAEVTPAAPSASVATPAPASSTPRKTFGGPKPASRDDGIPSVR